MWGDSVFEADSIFLRPTTGLASDALAVFMEEAIGSNLLPGTSGKGCLPDPNPASRQNHASLCSRSPGPGLLYNDVMTSAGALGNLERAVSHQNNRFTNLVTFNPNYDLLPTRGAYMPIWDLDLSGVQKAEADADANKRASEWAGEFTLTDLDLQDTSPLR